MPAITQKISPFLWFNSNAEEAAKFYVSVFPDSRIVRVARVGEGGPPEAGKPGSVLVVYFELAGQPFTALNGGPQFTFDEAVSFVVACDSQQEIDSYWEKLTGGGGRPVQCGWLKDRFGLSWQIVPSNLPELMSDPTKTARVMQVVIQMVKLDMAKMQAAAEGR
jgi:predicted 3-demethylubiquinone-9 3-methyltransferase (glyoxalase superfamily)